MNVFQSIKVQGIYRIYEIRFVPPARPRSAPLWVPTLPSLWSQWSVVSLSLQSALLASYMPWLTSTSQICGE